MSNLSVSNVTVDKAVRKAETKILPEISFSIPVDTESIISFKNANISNEILISGEETLSMAKSGFVIVDHTKAQGITPNTFTMLFNAQNTSTSVDNVISMFNLSSTTPSRLIRVIRSGINAPTSLQAETVLGISGDVPSGAITYIFFQVNGIGDNLTETPSFITYSDWSFVVSLRNDIIEGQNYKRICFNVII